MDAPGARSFNDTSRGPSIAPPGHRVQSFARESVANGLLLAVPLAERHGPWVRHVWLAVGLLLVVPTAVAAQPVVRVRAEARIELHVGREPGVVRIEGTLRDDLGQALADRRVEVRVLDAAQQLRGRALDRTDGAGSIRATFPLEPGEYRVVARWDGDDDHQRVEVAQALDLARAHVRLVVGLGGAGRIDLDNAEHRVEVRGSSDEGGAGLRIEIRDELDRPLADGVTDLEGRLHFTIPTAALGEPAAGRLLVRTPGDARRAAAQTEVPIVRFRPSQIALEASAERAASGEPVTLSGRLFDSAGPLGRRAVGLFVDERHLETVLTDDLGRFSRSVEVSEEGTVQIVASYVSDAPWRTSARSAPVILTLEGTGSAPWPWLLAPTLACALAVWWLSRRPEPTRVGTSSEPAVTAKAGVEVARPTSAVAQHREVAGTVVDAEDGQPIAAAVLTLTSGDGPHRSVLTDDDGRFAVEGLPGSDWTLEARATGYLVTEARIHLPHRGQWSATRVRLRTLRQAALIEYRPVAEALAPQPKWWAFWTPRELADRAASKARREVQDLTADVERAVYAATPPDPRDVEAIAERAAKMVRVLDER